MHPDVDSTKRPTAHTPGTCTHWEGLTFLTYLLLLVRQSCDPSKPAGLRRPPCCSAPAASEGIAAHGESLVFHVWPHLLGTCSLGTGCRLFPCEQRTSNLELSGSSNMLAVTSLHWSVLARQGTVCVEAKIMWRRRYEWTVQH